MNFAKLPSVDEAWAYLFHLSPLPASIVGLLLVVRILYGWYDSAKKTAERGMTIAHGAQRALAHTRTMSGGAIGVAITASLATLIAQGLWLVLSFLIGNWLSEAVGVNHGLDGIHRNAIPTWTQYTRALHWDGVAAGYVLFSLTIIIRAYVLAMRGDHANGWIYLFGLPGYLYGILEIPGGTIYVVLNLVRYFSHKPLAIAWHLPIFMIASGIAGLLYWLACRLVFRAPLLLTEMWAG